VVSQMICFVGFFISQNILDGNEQAVFTGDTLFIGGCGKFFEGTAAQMQSSLQKLAALDPNTVNIFLSYQFEKEKNVLFRASIVVMNIQRRILNLPQQSNRIIKI
jgi:hypothetical protein